MRTPRGASELIRARLLRKVPAEPIAVCDLPALAKVFRGAGIFCLLAGPGAWDMRCLHALPVVAYCTQDDALGLAESIAEAEPSEFAYVDRSGVMAMLREMH